MDDGFAGDGPYCSFCHNAQAEYRASPETFDMADHVKNCPARKEVPMSAETEKAVEDS